MSRTATRDPTVHRELDARLKGGGQRGDDVELLSAATRKRLGARGYPESAKPPRTDTHSENLAEYVADALYALGAATATVGAARAGRVTEGAQRMVRYPGTRSADQLRRAEQRAGTVADRASNARRKAAAGASTAGSSTVAAQRARAAEAATYALVHNGRHYTQGSRRWDPIRSGARPGGPMFDYGDCSAFATWVVWHALGRTGPDVVNGADWKAGYTGTMRVHGRSVLQAATFYPGDCAIYGGGVGKHTAVCRKAGTAATARWASFGSEGGPFDVSLRYRGDLSDVRRYIGV